MRTINRETIDRLKKKSGRILTSNPLVDQYMNHKFHTKILSNSNPIRKTNLCITTNVSEFVFYTVEIISSLQSDNSKNEKLKMITLLLDVRYTLRHMLSFFSGVHICTDNSCAKIRFLLHDKAS